MKLFCLKIVAVVSFCSYAGDELPPLQIHELREGVYLHTSYQQVEGWGVVSANGLVVVENNNAFIVDTPWSENDTEALVKWIAAKQFILQGSISTHYHEDRTAGIKWLNEHAIATYATSLTNRFLQQQNKPLAQNVIQGDDAVLAEGMINVFYPGGGHTLDNVVVWLPKFNMLFGGCFIRSLDSKGLGNIADAHIDQWAGSVERVVSRFNNVQIVVPGHGEVGSAELLTHTQTLALSAISH